MSEVDALVLTQTTTVTTADADCYGRLRPASLVNFLLQSAVASADQLGFGLAYLREHNLYWVLSRISVHIYSNALWRDELKITTWPRNVERRYYLRDFEVKDLNGNLIAAATSAWLAIDMQTKRPVRLDDDKSDVFIRLKEKSCGIHELPLIEVGADIPRNKYEINPVYSDFDLNGHVTTTRYIDWVMNTFSFRYHREKRVNSFQVNFLKEVLPGDTLVLERYSDEDSFIFEGSLERSGKPAFRIKTDFKPG